MPTKTKDKPATSQPTPSPTPSSYSRGRASATGVIPEVNLALKRLEEHNQTLQPKLTKSLSEKVAQILPSLGVKNAPPELVARIANDATNLTLENLGLIQDPAQINHVLADNLVEQIYAHPEISKDLKVGQSKAYGKVLGQTANVVQQNQPSFEQIAVLGNLIKIAGLRPSSSFHQSTIKNSIETISTQQAPLISPQEKAILTSASNSYADIYTKNLTTLIQSKGGLQNISLVYLQELKQKAHVAATHQAQENLPKTLSPNLAKVNFQSITTEIAARLHLAPLIPEQIEIYGLGYAQPKVTTFTKSAPSLTAMNLGLSLSRPKQKQEAYLSLLGYNKDRLRNEIESLTKSAKDFEEKIKNKRSLPFNENQRYTLDKKHLAVLQEAQQFQIKKTKKAQAYLTHFSKFNLQNASDTAWNTTHATFNKFGFYVPKSVLGNKRLSYLLANRTFGSLAFQLGVFRMEFPLGATLEYLHFSQIFQNPLPRSFFFHQGGPSPQNFYNPIKNARSRILGQTQTARTAIQTGSALVKGVSGPIGWAMLGAQVLANKNLRRALAAAAAAVTYLIFMLGLKLLGLVAGLIFGAITGAPLLLIPGIGPVLWLGWTAGWGLYGFANPIGLINTITNVATFPSKAWATITDSFTGGAGGIVTGFSSIIGGFLSTIGSWISSAASSLWGALSGAAGAITGGISSLGSAAFGATSAAAAPVVFVSGAVIGIGSTTVITGVIVATAFFSTQSELENITAGDNQYFRVSKTASASHIDNPPPNKDLTFTVTITAKVNLTGIQVTDQMTVSPKNKDSFTVTSDNSGNPISPLSCGTELIQGNVCTKEIKITVDDKFTDSLISNKVTVIATNPDQQQITDSTTSVVTVGQSQTNCFVYQGDWTEAEKSLEDAAIAELAKSPAYMGLLCSAGTIILNRIDVNDWNFVVCPNIINISNIGLGNQANTTYVLAHESGHIIQCQGLQVYQDFLNAAPFSQEGFICSYPLGKTSFEDFAETIAVYVVWKYRTFGNCSGGSINFPTDYPLHNSFAKNNLFGGVEY